MMSDNYIDRPYCLTQESNYLAIVASRRILLLRESRKARISIIPSFIFWRWLLPFCPTKLRRSFSTTLSSHVCPPPPLLGTFAPADFQDASGSTISVDPTPLVPPSETPLPVFFQSSMHRL